ncbi:transporter [Nocardia seriolae]|nr:transporter [Nocardia seriolae]
MAAFLAAALLAWAVALVIRPMAQRLAVTGGLYTYVAKGLGPFVAVPTGWSAIVGYASVSVAGLLAVGTYLDQLAVTAGLAGFGGTATIVGLLLVAAVVEAVLMVRGIRLSASATLLVECVSVVTVLALMGYLLTRDAHAPRPAPVFEWHGGTGTLAMSAVVAVSAFVGFESATTLSAEAYRPFRSVPRTLVWTPLAAAVIYLIAVTAQAVALAAAPRAPPRARHRSPICSCGAIPDSSARSWISGSRHRSSPAPSPRSTRWCGCCSPWAASASPRRRPGARTPVSTPRPPPLSRRWAR